MKMNKQTLQGVMLKIRDEVLCKQMSDVCALLDLRSGAFYTLNETASLFWKMIEQQTPIDDICASITQQYDISHEEVLQDLAEFIDFFVKEQLLNDSMFTE